MQRIETCDEHERCTLITDGGWPDEVGSWRSHLTADVDPAVRLNIDFPEAEDNRDA